MASPLTRTQARTIGLAGVGSFMVVVDLLAVSTAAPQMQADLHASPGTLAWAVNAYTLSFAVLLLTAATFGDRWGRQRLYAGGLILFAVASLACALSPNVPALLAARVLQGAGAAAILPLALALLNAALPPERRGWAMGVYGAITALGAVLGPVLGGALTQELSWRWIFWINVPVGLVAAVAVLRFVADSRGQRRPLDPAGLLLSVVAAVGVVWGIIRAASVGWGQPEVIGALAVGVVAVGGFVAWQHRTVDPMVPLRLFSDRGFSAGNAAIFLANGTITAVVFFTAQFLQEAQGSDPLSAGLRLLPTGLVPLFLAPRAGAAADRFGPRRLVVIGLFVLAGSTLWLGLAGTAHRPYAGLVIPFLLFGTGLTLAIPALTKAVVSSVSPADVGIASGVFTTTRQLGGAFGIALGSTALAAGGGVRTGGGYDVAMYIAGGLATLGALTALRMRLPAKASSTRTAIPIAESIAASRP